MIIKDDESLRYFCSILTEKKAIATQLEQDRLTILLMNAVGWIRRSDRSLSFQITKKRAHFAIPT
jgi:hypothetical protein